MGACVWRWHHFVGPRSLPSEPKGCTFPIKLKALRQSDNNAKRCLFWRAAFGSTVCNVHQSISDVLLMWNFSLLAFKLQVLVWADEAAETKWQKKSSKSGKAMRRCVKYEDELKDSRRREGEYKNGKTFLITFLLCLHWKTDRQRTGNKTNAIKINYCILRELLELISLKRESEGVHFVQLVLADVQEGFQSLPAPPVSVFHEISKVSHLRGEKRKESEQNHVSTVLLMGHHDL